MPNGLYTDSVLYIPPRRHDVTKSGVVRKNMRLTQAKIDRAKKILGTRTETETVEEALDLVAFRREVIDGIERIAGTGALRDVYEDAR